MYKGVTQRYRLLTFDSMLFKNCIIFSKSYMIHSCLCSRLLKFFFKNPCFQLPQDLLNLFIVKIEAVFGGEHSCKVSKFSFVNSYS